MITANLYNFIDGIDRLWKRQYQESIYRHNIFIFRLQNERKHIDIVIGRKQGPSLQDMINF